VLRDVTSVHLSVMMVDNDHAVRQKVEMSTRQDRLVATRMPKPTLPLYGTYLPTVVT